MIKLTEFFKCVVRDDHSAQNAAASGPTLTIAKLLHEAFEQFGHVSRENNEKLRLHHRLKVVQQLEDTERKNVIRSVKDISDLTLAELHALYAFIKNEQMNKPCLEDPGQRSNPAFAHYELYKVDLAAFKVLFRNLSPWGRGQEMGQLLAERLFRLMDANNDNRLNFKEVVQVTKNTNDPLG